MSGRQVLAIGVFDLFHVGHLRYLQHARSRGDSLTVGVTPDEICLAVKGRLPVMNEMQRLEIVRGLACVSEARLLPTSTDQTQAAVEWILAWGVDHVVAGGGWQGSARWRRLEPALVAQGVSVEYAPHTEGISTTALLARICAEATR